MDPRATDQETARPRQPKGGAEALRPFIGKWVLLDREGEVRASGDSAEEVLSAADAAGLDAPLFLFVPRPGFIG